MLWKTVNTKADLLSLAHACHIIYAIMSEVIKHVGRIQIRVLRIPGWARLKFSTIPTSVKEPTWINIVPQWVLSLPTSNLITTGT